MSVLDWEFDNLEEDEMKHPAYNLKTNKSVDRLLFVDILRKLDPECKDYTYYSLGGPFLEDLRVMDHFFPEMKLVSLESNEQTYKRQNFNKFSSRIELRHQGISEFIINEYNPESKSVFWLDYTDLKLERLTEFQSLLSKVIINSVVRITLNAAPSIDLSSIKNRVSEDIFNQIKNNYIQELNDRYDKFLDTEIDQSVIRKGENFATMVQGLVRMAASKELEVIGNNTIYLPLQSVYYTDTTRMLSVTGIVCKREDVENIKNKVKNCRFINTDWNKPHELNIPALTLKERLHLEAYLPVKMGEDAGQILYNNLNYKINDTERKTIEQLTHYAECQRDYPTFIRASI